ncbi:MAG: pilus assembly protein TadG-related protein, partial [Pseudomonadota bacterium]
MATQVVVFSVLLFGTSGVVLDFGRVYSEHSSMQSYTDQAALAAAAELDQTAGAIQRAIDSVYGDAAGTITPISKTAVFSNGDTQQFEISHLLFLRDLGDDTGAQYEVGDALTGDNVVFAAFSNGGVAGDDIEAASIDARFVVAVAEERSVRNTLVQLINATGSDTVRPTQVLRTVAAARGRRMTCGDFDRYSSFVMCDPYSVDPDLSFSDEMTELEDGVIGTRNKGRQFRLTADGSLTGINKLHRLRDYSATSATQALCDNPSTLPGYDPSMSAAEAAFTRSICYLSSTDPVEDDVCLQDEVAIMPLSGEQVTTSLNVAFNMWDEPIAEVLDWRLDPSRVDDQALFQPDVHIMKGRIWHDGREQINAGRGIPTSSRLNYADASDHGDIDIIRKWSCLNPIAGAGSTAGCAAYSDGAAIDYVGEAPTLTELTEYYATNTPINYLLSLSGLINVGDVTYYDMYLQLRQEGVHNTLGLPLLPEGASMVAFPPVDETAEGSPGDIAIAPDDLDLTR